MQNCMRIICRSFFLYVFDVITFFVFMRPCVVCEIIHLAAAAVGFSRFLRVNFVVKQKENTAFGIHVPPPPNGTVGIATPTTKRERATSGRDLHVKYERIVFVRKRR